MRSARVKSLYEITGFDWLKIVTGGVLRGFAHFALGFSLCRAIFWIVTGH